MTHGPSDVNSIAGRPLRMATSEYAKQRSANEGPLVCEGSLCPKDMNQSEVLPPHGIDFPDISVEGQD